MPAHEKKVLAESFFIKASLCPNPPIKLLSAREVVTTLVRLHEQAQQNEYGIQVLSNPSYLILYFLPKRNFVICKYLFNMA